MRQRLAHGESGLLQAAFALEHDGQYVCRTAWTASTGVHHVGQTLVLMAMPLADTCVHSAKRLAVRGQGQGVSRQTQILVDRLQKKPQPLQHTSVVGARMRFG
jgi:hypothetical protein